MLTDCRKPYSASSGNSKGKPKKLNFTAAQSFSPFGVYFWFSTNGVGIANYTTQTTFYREKFDSDGKTLDWLPVWLDKWISTTSADDLRGMEAFRVAKRQHCKFAEGDFFAFRIDRWQWGFGRILIDVARLRKTEGFKESKNYGLNNLMDKPLIVKVYHKIADTPDVDLDELAGCPALPVQAVMDNEFYYGEHPILGHRDLTMEDLGDDLLISYGRSIDYRDKTTVYLQYGMIYSETTVSEFDKYLHGVLASGYGEENPYRNESIGIHRICLVGVADGQGSKFLRSLGIESTVHAGMAHGIARVPLSELHRSQACRC